MRRKPSPAWWLLVLAAAGPARAHDIPNARVDRSIQVGVEPGRLRVDYELSIGELTLTQELRQLIGDLPGADRADWFAAYGRETGPLNAKGVLVTVDGAEVELKSVGFDLAIEGHPRYTFHFAAEIPPAGHLRLVDTNFAASEGTSRLAIRGEGGVAVRGDPLPGDVSLITIQPVWQLSNAEERRTRQVTVEYAPTTSTTPTARPAPSPVRTPPDRTASSSMSWLLDDAAGRGRLALLLAAFVLGVGHAIQPGHGKTLVASASLGPGSSPFRGALLGLVTASAHLSSVALIALVVWRTRGTGFESLHLGLARGSGFAIAAVGCWRVGRSLGGFSDRDRDDPLPGSNASRTVLTLGLAGGLVPCWDAVSLVVVSQAIGRLGLGLILLAAFSLGMAGVLVAVGMLAGRFRAGLEGSSRFRGWGRWLGLAGGTILTLIGGSLLLGP